MPAIDRRLIQNFDWLLFGLAALLTLAGLVNLFSSTHTDAPGMSDEMRRQLLSLAIGVVAMVATVAVDYRHYEP
jgi:rod shape determining protein RodA